jgi:Trk K+ transport system NAD-binding subunit
VPPITRRRPHVIVCGDNPLTFRLVEELTIRYRVEVRVILPSRQRNRAPEIAAMANVKVVETERLDEEAFRNARIDIARAVAFLEQDDVGNIHAALRAQEIRPGIRLVVRIFNTNLGHRLGQLFADCAFLSDASIAAPSFVAAALGEVAPNHARLPGRTLYVAHRGDVVPDKVICGLAGGDFSDPGEVFPEDHDSADLVLAVADGQIREPLRRGRFRWRPHVLLWTGIRAMFGRRLWIATAFMVAVLVVGSVLYGVALDLDHWYDSLYYTLLTAAGGAEPDKELDAGAKVIQTVVMLSGIALVPLVTAAVVDGMVSARLAATVGRLRDFTRSHIVVVGLGNVGSRVMTQLHDLGLPVVAVDRDPQAIGVRIAQERRIPVILGDATQAETLRAARVPNCRAVVAVTSDDVKNLEAALHARSMSRDLRIVLRLFDGDLAALIQRRFTIAASRSVASLAAPDFATAMLERRVFDTIPVGRRVLMFAEFPVAAGSELHGRTVETAHIPGRARVIALGRPGVDPLWPAPPGRVLAPDDRLIVLATRDGVGQMIQRTEPALGGPA